MTPLIGLGPTMGAPYPLSVVHHCCHCSPLRFPNSKQTYKNCCCFFSQHFPVFLLPTSPSSTSLKFLISVTSFHHAPFDVRHLIGPTPAPFVVAVHPPQLAPWGHYSSCFFLVVARTRCRGFLAFAAGSAPEERDAPLEGATASSGWYRL